MKGRALLAATMAFTLTTAAWADVKFTKLAENRFIVHHRKVTALGAEAKAVKTAYKEAASICLAAGFTHMEIKDQNIGERIHGGFWGGGRGASADLRIKLFLDPEEAIVDEKDLVKCKPLADPKKVKVAEKKLAREDD